MSALLHDGDDVSPGGNEETGSMKFRFGALGLAFAAFAGMPTHAQTLFLGYNIKDVDFPKLTNTAGTNDLADNRICHCDLRIKKTLCLVNVNVKDTGSGTCEARMPYSHLMIMTNEGAEDVGVLWRLSPASEEYAYAQGTGIHLVPQRSVAGNVGAGFLSFVRFNDLNAIWFARSLPKDVRFEGLHLPIVVRLPEDSTQLRLCTPVDPPITNTGY